MQAYRETDFVVRHDGGEIVLRVGALNRRLDPLLKAAQCETWAFVTAWNPASRSLPRRVNAGRNRRLRLDIARHGYQWLPGEGRARSGDWPPEQSFLILGIPLWEARIIGCRYGQLATLVGRLGKKARLCRCLS